MTEVVVLARQRIRNDDQRDAERPPKRHDTVGNLPAAFPTGALIPARTPATVESTPVRTDDPLLRPAVPWRGEDLHLARAAGVPGGPARPATVAGCAAAALAAIYVLALWIQAAVYLPKEIVLLVFLGAAGACRQVRPFLRDWAVPLLLLFTMDALREVAYGVTRGLDRAVIVSWPIRADRAVFGTLPTLALQSWLHPTPEARWYDVVMAALHGSHFVSFLLVGLAVWSRRPDRFRLYVTAVLVTAYAGLAGYFLVPTAPPWLAAELGHLPPTPRLLLSVPYVELPRFLLVGLDTNPVAAMPSLHAAFSLVVARGLGLLSPRAGRLGYLYVVAVAVAAVYGGEHYVVDLVAGYAVAALGFWLAGADGRRARAARAPAG
jgi:membrane-associated phospholipid phosphatase